MTKRIFKYIILFLRLGFFVVGAHQAWIQDWTGVFVVSQAILISFIPNLLWKYYKIYTPFSLRVGIVFFMCFTLILGELADFYDMFWWWDLALHTVAGVGITLIGFISLLAIFRQSDLRAAPFFTAALAVSISLAAAVVWEIYEFLIDTFFPTGSLMQPSNHDTMTDLIVATLGSLVVGLSGYRYLKNRKVDIITDIIKDGAERNNISH
ncbi:MAG: hypothetical protein ACK42D_02640 [Candidatus Paceibacteria bacterium]